MKIKLNKKVIQKLKAPDPSSTQKLHWDEELRGFGVLCSGVSSTKTYVVQREVDGKTRRVTVAQVGEIELDEARTKAGRMINDMRAGHDPKVAAKARRGGSTLREALESYLASAIGQNLKPRSREEYRAVIERRLAGWLDRPLREATPDAVVARHKEIQAGVAVAAAEARVAAEKRRKAKVAKAEAALAAATSDAEREIAKERLAIAREPGPTPWASDGAAAANGAFRVFGAIWNHAAARDATLPANPVMALRRGWFKVPRRERLVRAEDLPKFHEALLGLPNTVQRDYVRFLLFTGLRRREAASLTWDDVDLAGGVVRIAAARTKAGRKLDLPMTDVVREILVTRRAPGKDRFVFPSDSRSGHVEEPKFALDQVARACGVRISAHDLRRTYVTTAASADISPLAMKALVNHSLGNDVTSGYVIISASDLLPAAQRVADRLKRLCGIAEPTGENVAKLPAGRTA